MASIFFYFTSLSLTCINLIFLIFSILLVLASKFRFWIGLCWWMKSKEPFSAYKCGYSFLVMSLLIVSFCLAMVSFFVSPFNIVNSWSFILFCNFYFISREELAREYDCCSFALGRMLSLLCFLIYFCLCWITVSNYSFWLPLVCSYL